MHMYISWVSIVQTPHPLLHGYGFALYPLLFCGGSGGTLLDTGRTTSATGTNSTMTYCIPRSRTSTYYVYEYYYPWPYHGAARNVQRALINMWLIVIAYISIAQKTT